MSEQPALDLQTHVKRTIGYWCNRLTRDATFVMHDVVRGVARPLPSRYYPRQDDLQAMVWVKISESMTWEKIRTIWFDPGADGGPHGVSRYLSLICTNTFIDEHRKMQTRPWDHAAISLQTEIGGENEDDEGEIVQLIDLITNEDSAEVLPFGMEDLIKVLSPQEYKVIFDHIVNDGDYRSLAEDIGMSKSQIARIAQRAITKAKTWIEQLKHGPKVKAGAYRTALIASVPWLNRRSWRPDRMPSENLEHWWDEAELRPIPFFRCGHDPSPGTYAGSSGMNQMQAGGTRWALCDTCDRNYWRSLKQQIEADVLEAHVARMEKMISELNERGTEALGSPQVVVP